MTQHEGPSQPEISGSLPTYEISPEGITAALDIAAQYRINADKQKAEAEAEADFNTDSPNHTAIIRKRRNAREFINLSDEIADAFDRALPITGEGATWRTEVESRYAALKEKQVADAASDKPTTEESFDYLYHGPFDQRPHIKNALKEMQEKQLRQGK
jgi:hypothetical protein